jgi:hypothetical protein
VVTDTGELVVVRTPRGRSALPVMRVVVGWVASCHDLSLDRLDDVQLAIETLLADEFDTGDDLSLSLSIGRDSMNLRLEGLQNQSLKNALVTSDAFRPRAGCRLDVRLFLGALLDSYQVVGGREGPFAVEMEKRIS